MTNLLPVDETLAQELDTRLARTMFRSTKDFIEFYNSGLVNKNAEEVAGFASEVDATFKNVKLQGKNLVFISKIEVELEETLTELKKWTLVVRFKDKLNALLAENAVAADDVVTFHADQTGVLYSMSRTNENGDMERVLDEKLFKPAEEELANAVVAEYSSLENKGEFKVSDFAEVDDSFISDIYQLIFN